MVLVTKRNKKRTRNERSAFFIWVKPDNCIPAFSFHNLDLNWVSYGEWWSHSQQLVFPPLEAPVKPLLAADGPLGLGLNPEITGTLHQNRRINCVNIKALLTKSTEWEMIISVLVCSTNLFKVRFHNFRHLCIYIYAWSETNLNISTVFMKLWYLNFFTVCFFFTLICITTWFSLNINTV